MPMAQAAFTHLTAFIIAPQTADFRSGPAPNKRQTPRSGVNRPRPTVPLLDHACRRDSQSERVGAPKENFGVNRPAYAKSAPAGEPARQQRDFAEKRSKSENSCPA